MAISLTASDSCVCILGMIGGRGGGPSPMSWGAGLVSFYFLK